MFTNRLGLVQGVARHLGYRTHQRAFSLKSFGALVQEIKASNKNIHHISPKDLHALSSASSSTPHIIDVREKQEIEATGTIPGAIVLPRGILERDVGKVLKQDDSRDIVVYCAGGFRSILAAESLTRLGYGGVEETQQAQDRPKVWSLNEGFDGWVKNGFTVEKK
ncbi:Rhodanese-like domain-containing protein [Mortierella sp. GBAus27b]|nr:Rhodanese-like domain-containing protein [Mortierella sp. GBAus27b]